MEITLLGLIVLIVLSAIVGFVAQKIVGFRSGGLLAAIGVGFVGALLGILLANGTGLPTLLAVNLGGMSFPIAWALLGSILLVAALGLVLGRGRGRRRRYV